MRSRSDFVRIRGLRYHVRRWGAEDAPMIFLGHGWMDVSETFDPVAQALLPQWQVLIPDWRGFGYTEWPQEGYWFPDYVADLDGIADHYSPDRPIFLAGHSMGAQIASLFAGLRPKRVAKLALLDGLFMPDMNVKLTPERYAKWLDGTKTVGKRPPTYDSFEYLASRVQKRHAQLTTEQALFIARCWARENDKGKIELLCDPKHLIDGPRPYRQLEADLVWAKVEAPTLFIDGAQSPFPKLLGEGEKERRRALFRNRSETAISGAQHMLHFDQPLALASVLSGFFSG
jgi:pimeloyl-ACP methyl ester carboxylesterase